MNTKIISEFFITLLIAVVAISLNVLLTVKLNEEHIGIRIAATDFLIPLILILFVIKVVKEKRISGLILPYGWTLLIVMTMWMGFSLVNGYYYIGSMTTWPLVNKFFGWFVLMSYFVTGVYIGSYKANSQLIFFRSLFITSWLICISQIIVHWCFAHGFFHEYNYVASHYRMEGFYQNPNAFGIFLCVIFLFHLYAVKEKKIFRKPLIIIGATLTLFCILYSYSRSAWLGLVLVLFATAIFNRKFILTVIIIFSVTFIINFLAFSEQTRDVNIQIIEHLYSKVQYAVAKSEQAAKHTGGEKISPQEISEKADQTVELDKPVRPVVKRATITDRVKSDRSSVSTRIEILKRSLTYWKEHPVVGIGLGGHLWNSQNAGISEDSSTMHNSINWLLVETGIIGLLIFSAFILSSLKYLYLFRNNQGYYISTNAMIGVIIIMIGASAGTEVIYQRYFWLFLGLFLVLPAGTKEQCREKT